MKNSSENVFLMNLIFWHIKMVGRLIVPPIVFTTKFIAFPEKRQNLFRKVEFEIVSVVHYLILI